MGSRSSWRILLVGIGASLLVACADDATVSRPPVSDLKEGLNLYDVTDPSWGMAGAYLKNGHAVYFETRVGAPKPNVYREAWPDDPPNEIDLRFLDENGHTFYVRRGGDNYVDPTWQEEIDADRGFRPDPVRRQEDFALAQEAAQSFMVSPPAGFQDHTYHIATFAQMPTPSEDPAMLIRGAEIEQQAKPDAAYYDYNFWAWNWPETDLYYGSTGCFAWVCFAKHSATRMWDYLGYYDGYGNWIALGWVFAEEACNHGRCAYDSGMGYSCYSNGGWFWNATINGETNSEHGGGTAISGGCQTPYNWDSGGYDHLCNDDAAYELWQAKSGSKWTSQGDGWSFKWFNASSTKGNSYFACTCNTFNNCDNDWGAPSCP